MQTREGSSKDTKIHHMVAVAAEVKGKAATNSEWECIWQILLAYKSQQRHNKLPVFCITKLWAVIFEVFTLTHLFISFVFVCWQVAQEERSVKFVEQNVK